METKRRIEFEEHEIVDLDFAKNASNEFDNIDMVLPDNLYQNLQQTIYNVNLIKTTYIKNGGELLEILITYREYKEKYKKLWIEADKYYNKNKNEKLICHKDEGDWLKANYENIWLEVAKNNGFFTEDTLKYMFYNNYISKRITEFEKHLTDSSLKIIGLNNNVIRFSIHDEKYHYPVYFNIPNKSFMELIGCHCLTKANYSFTRADLKDITIEQNNSNFEALHNRMVVLMNKAHLDVEFNNNSKTYYYKKIPVVQKSPSGKRITTSEVGYKKIVGQHFFDLCKDILFSSDDTIQQKFTNFYDVLKLKGIWMSKKDKDEREKISADVSFQKPKEFI